MLDACAKRASDAISADRRVVIVTDAQRSRRSRVAICSKSRKTFRDGNSLVILDLLAASPKRPVPLGGELGRSATPHRHVVERAARERRPRNASDLEATAEPRVISELSRVKLSSPRFETIAKARARREEDYV